MKRMQIQNKNVMLAKIFSLCILCTLVIAMFCSCSAQDPNKDTNAGQTPSTSSSVVDKNNNSQINVTVKIDTSNAVSLGYTKQCSTANYEVKQGGTAYDALCASGLPIEGEPSYVTSIDGLFQQAYGSMSGWMYAVNGEIAMVASNEYVLKDSDTVTWIYTVNGGEDVGDKLS